MSKSIISSKNPAQEIQASPDYQLTINQQNIFVYSSDVASYATLSGAGEVLVEIEANSPFQKVVIRPLQLGITPEIDGSVIRFRLQAPQKVSVELDDRIQSPLFILINPLETEKPVAGQPHVHYFASGQTYDVGLFEIGAGETVYIEEGAVVYGALISEKVDNVRIMGRGILNGSRLEATPTETHPRLLRTIEGNNISIEGITLVEGPSWHVYPIACQGVTIRDLNIITIAGTGDGIDIVGSSHVNVSNCFIRSMDDCIAIKAVDYDRAAGCRNVENVHISKSIFWNAEWGNALEIGYETRCQEIKNITFEDCDIIRCQLEGYQSGGAFTIHNGDRAFIHDVTYENIRVEDCQEKLFDIKIQYSQYSRDEERGQIDNIHFKDIQVLDGRFPVSIIRGYDGEHMVGRVTFENVVIHGQKISDANEARMVVEVAKEIIFK